MIGTPRREEPRAEAGRGLLSTQVPGGLPWARGPEGLGPGGTRELPVLQGLWGGAWRGTEG